MKQIEFNRNEQLYGPSPLCYKAIKKLEKEHVKRYLDGYYRSILKDKLSEIYSISYDRIIVGYGAEDIFRSVFDSLRLGDSVLTHDLYYSYYKKYLDRKEVKLETFRMTDTGDEFAFDVEDCIKSVNEIFPKVLVITSPNNPTGNSISPSLLERILGSISSEILVVLDEAYFGFDPEYKEKEFLSLLEQYPSLLIMRSFSKLYGLAGMRIGYALCGKNVTNMIRYQDNYLGMSRILEEVGVVALESGPYYRKVSTKIIGERDKMNASIRGMKHFHVYKSKANFVLIRVDENKVEALKDALREEKILIGKFINANLFRISLGLPRHNRNFVKLLNNIDKS